MLIILLKKMNTYLSIKTFRYTNTKNRYSRFVKMLIQNLYYTLRQQVQVKLLHQLVYRNRLIFQIPIYLLGDILRKNIKLFSYVLLDMLVLH